MGPWSVTLVCSQSPQYTFLSLYPWSPWFAVGARCPGDARDARDGRVPSAATLGLGDVQQTQEHQRQQHWDAAPRGLHHGPAQLLPVCVAVGDKKMR